MADFPPAGRPLGGIGFLAPAAVQRIFIDLDPVLQSHFLLQNPVVETGDFNIKVDLSTSSTATQVLFSGNANNSFVQIRALGTELVLNANGQATVYTVALLADGKFNSVELDAVSGQCSLTVNGSTISTLACGTGFTFDKIAVLADGVTQLFSGTIANVDLGNGNKWPLGQKTGNTEQAANGANLLTYVNIPESNRELFELSSDATQWNNISPPVQVLPAIIEVA